MSQSFGVIPSPRWAQKKRELWGHVGFLQHTNLVGP